jgi:hypothetical protein
MRNLLVFLPALLRLPIQLYLFIKIVIVYTNVYTVCIKIGIMKDLKKVKVSILV